MHTPSPAALAVAPATGGEVTDHILEQVIDAARKLTRASITDAEGSLLVLTAAPLLEELLQWRRKAALISDLVQPDNVIMFGGAN